MSIPRIPVAGSAVAIVHGFDTLAPEYTLSAVVSNRVGAERNYGFLRDAIKARCRTEPVGYLPRGNSLTIPEQHLDASFCCYVFDRGGRWVRFGGDDKGLGVNYESLEKTIVQMLNEK